MPKSKTDYKLAPKAKGDIEAIWLHSSSNWGIDQANHYFDQLTKTFELLALNPNAGSTCNSIRHGYRRYHFKKHMIYYRETNGSIEIMRILHDRMLTSRYL